MRSLLVLRPEPGAARTVERAKALGLQAKRWPLFRIEPLSWSAPEGRFDGLLLTSANAVRHAGPLPDLPVHAVGPATAEAAAAAGARIASTGEGGVDELLALLPGSDRLLHLCGEERTEPAAAGPEIVAVPVYRAEPLAPPPASLVEGRVVLVHSPAAGRRLASFSLRRERVRVAAISPAAAEACGPGWERLGSAPRPSDPALLSLAAELCKD
jgi:uroporphyrinogen-III synthase